MTGQQLWMGCDTEPNELEHVKILDQVGGMDSRSGWTFISSLLLHDPICYTNDIEGINVMGRKSDCLKIEEMRYQNCWSSTWIGCDAH